VEPQQPRLRLVRVLWAILGVTPLRFVLAAAVFAGSVPAGAQGGSARLAFVLGIFGGAGFVLADPRRRMRSASVQRPAPAEFDLEEPWRSAFRSLYPSTLGLAVLGAIAIAFDPLLSAILAGVIAGLGVASLVTAVDVLQEERRLGARLYTLSAASWTSRERGAATLFVEKT
jgi:hypothetical protein